MGPREQKASSLKTLHKLVAWWVALLAAALMSWHSACLPVPIPHGATTALSLRSQKTLASAGLGAAFSLWTEEMSFLKYCLPVHILFYAD